jgi:hypothetical protein
VSFYPGVAMKPLLRMQLLVVEAAMNAAVDDGRTAGQRCQCP